MVSKLSRLWKSLVSAETVERIANASESLANASEKVFDLAETLRDKDNLKDPKVKELVATIPTLLEALNSPLGQVVKSSVPFLPIATGLIQFAISVNKKEPTVAQTVAIISQVAYLESINKTIPYKLIPTNEKEKDFPEVKKQLMKLEKKLEIDYEEATLALVYFHESKIAEAFNEVLFARLEVTGIAQSEVQTWVEKVALNTQQYISQALAEAGEEIAVVRRILDWYQAGGKEEFVKRRSINYYLEKKIKSLPEEPVFKEKFSFQDIYVPLQGILLDKNGKETSSANKFVLEEWAQKFIVNPEESEKVLFIQAGAGRGKSVFCRMFADWVRRNLHPVLTPIVIRLRDIKNYNRPIDEILSSTLSRNFVKNYPGWLTDRHTRYLFLLDGFDELRIEGRASGEIDEFIQNVGKFQSEYSGSDQETGHRVIITGRSIALQGIDLPKNLTRVEIQPMNDEIRGRWHEKWSKLAILDNPTASWQETEKFKAFLVAENCPKDIKDDLAREPLLLYLLAKLHLPDQDGIRQISQDDFQQNQDTSGKYNTSQAKILIYKKSLSWVLKKQRNDEVFADLQKDITGLTVESLKRILIEAGLCVVQSGGEYGKVEMIESRFKKNNSEAANIIKKLREKSETNSSNGNAEKALTTALGAFYIQARGGGFEFYHKSFGEFLFAKRLVASLEKWTEPVSKVSKPRKLVVDDEQLVKEIYDLLGYGRLTPEIVEYLWGLLTKSDDFRPVELFDRLSDFYWRWCDGEFIDAEGTTLPQTKMRELKEQCPDRETHLGQRQVDVYAGLNIMILLLELHRYGQSQNDDIKQKLTFYPCGKLTAKGKPEDPILLLRVIGYSHCNGNNFFVETLGSFFAHVELPQANLNGAYLRGANFSSANLKRTTFVGAYLNGANFRGADLKGTTSFRGADLSVADFSKAKLEGVSLRGTYLNKSFFNGAFLNNADLSGADLSGADLSGADLTTVNLFKIKFDDTTDFQDVKGIETAINVPKALKRKLFL